jgi:hypothetical protein
VSDTEQNIEALLSEKRVFEASPSFVERALISDRSIYDRAAADPQRMGPRHAAAAQEVSGV